mmetsp:Transcript_12528/g.24981  ORF Transcript_12528/g.24981 Transcript_12528/m.24981 type:complete len:121 (-) Transcript_12528:462-824(-)
MSSLSVAQAHSMQHGAISFQQGFWISRARIYHCPCDWVTSRHIVSESDCICSDGGGICSGCRKVYAHPNWKMCMSKPLVPISGPVVEDIPYEFPPRSAATYIAGCCGNQVLPWKFVECAP